MCSARSEATQGEGPLPLMWACRCCQLLVQEPAAPQVFDNALPTPGLQAHTAISRFVDHIPYYRQEQINARCGVRTPRSTLAA